MYTELIKKKVFEQLTLAAATQTMFSMLVFMSRESGDATSKVSCCVQTSYCFKTSNFDAIVSLPPPALLFIMNVSENTNTVNLKSASFVVITLLHEGLTHIQSQIKPRLLFGERFTLTGTCVTTVLVFYAS